MPIEGGTATVFKQQFPRSDRKHMRAAIGPVVRFTIDLADPWAATYTLAGGEGGWPRSPSYGNLLEDWRYGRGRPMTPDPSGGDINVRFLPAGASAQSRLTSAHGRAQAGTRAGISEIPGRTS